MKSGPHPRPLAQRAARAHRAQPTPGIRNEASGAAKLAAQVITAMFGRCGGSGGRGSATEFS